MLICVNDDESFYLVDRSKKTPISKVKWNAPSLSFNYEVFAVPGFCIKKLPFLILRDDYTFRVFNVNTQKSYCLKEAPYMSKPGKIYRTMDVLPACGDDEASDGAEFELIYLVAEGNES
jgi:hypothetical protein